MKIYLLDNKEITTKTWSLYFQGCHDVEAVCDDFGHFMDTEEVECVVSPANSYGLMDGGYDYAISEWFGWDLMKKVQAFILEHYKGEQPVGISFIIDTGVKGIKLIHTPTMRVPSVIKDPMIIYTCMRTCLLTALDNGIRSIVVPAFGGGCGLVPPQTICVMMHEAYKQVMNPPKKIDDTEIIYYDTLEAMLDYMNKTVKED